MEEEIEFAASLPPIQSAISMDGNGDGARIKLDVPASDMAAVLLLQAWYAGKAFRVTVTPDVQVIAGDKTRDVAEGRKRKSAWQTKDATADGCATQELETSDS